MEVQPDFKELLALLHKHSVEYIIVGGYALAFHGAPRLTGDIGIYVHPQAENAVRILDDQTEFGFGSVGLTKEDFSVPNRVIQPHPGRRPNLSRRWRKKPGG